LFLSKTERDFLLNTGREISKPSNAISGTN
jgi:hypothetical protein